VSTHLLYLLLSYLLLHLISIVSSCRTRRTGRGAPAAVRSPCVACGPPARLPVWCGDAAPGAPPCAVRRRSPRHGFSALRHAPSACWCGHRHGPKARRRGPRHDAAPGGWCGSMRTVVCSSIWFFIFATFICDFLNSKCFVNEFGTHVMRILCEFV
jgi:hypothetical protein